MVALRKSQKASANDLFLLADKESDRGRHKSAFRLFLAAAKSGDRSAQLNIGYFYDLGIGTQSNKSTALYWYRKAYRRGEACAATNIATIWRDKRKLQRALAWFRRAVKMGDDDSNLDIAKHYLQNELDPRKAVIHLNRVCKSDRVTETTLDEAKQLLKTINKKLKG